MRFLYSLAFLAGVHAGGDDTTTTTATATSADTTATVAASTATPEVTDRLFTLPSASYAPAYPTYSGSCSYYYDCWSCLGNSACLWDPNTLGGTCKPATQCDFTYQARTLSLASAPAVPTATACVRTISQCGRQNFNGAILNPNPLRGVGCTNHGQCGANQYCYSCAKCVGSCGGCNTGFPSSGMCGPAYRCPIDGDSISGTCPGSTVYPPVPVYPGGSCGSYYSCSSCAAAYGCIWSGSYCYYSTVPCTGYGCANTPSQCYGGSIYPVTPIYPTYPGSSCDSYYTCSSCAAAYGCIWSGSYCYYSTVPCSGYGCANTPDQCYGGSIYPVTPIYPTYPTYPSSCSYYTCSSCTAAYGCIWSGSSCYYSTVPCTGYGCANTPSQCSVTPWGGWGSWGGYVPYTPYSSWP